MDDMLKALLQANGMTEADLTKPQMEQTEQDARLTELENALEILLTGRTE